MNVRIQRLGIFLVICYLAIFVKVHQTQLLDVEKLNATEGNSRPEQRKLNRPRGAIVSAEGELLAWSEDVGDNNTPRTRHYPGGELLGHVTGFFSGRFGSSGVEKVYNADLAGDTFQVSVQGITDLFSTKENVGNLTLTVHKGLQELARESLKDPRTGADREGSVVVLDPRNGEILAFWSYPSFNPGLLTEGTDDQAKAAWDTYLKAPGNPLLGKQYRERYFPGSTFKVVTAGIGLESGKVTPESPVYPTVPSFQPNDAPKPIENFYINGKPETCGGPLLEIMTISCNSAFAQMGVDIGGVGMTAGAEKFGFNQDVPIDLTNPAKSFVEKDLKNGQAVLAKTAIGQQDTQATPLQMALAAAAAANGGTIMKPHVLKDVRTNDNEVVRAYVPEKWLTPMSPTHAAQLAAAMLGPVNNQGGTATGIVKPPPGMVVGGKTGTAQTGGPGAPLHTWFMGYAGPLGQLPTIAVSVVVLNQTNHGEATGGAVAGPIANTMITEALKVVGTPPPANPLAQVTTTTSLPAPSTAPGGAPITTVATTRRQAG